MTPEHAQYLVNQIVRPATKAERRERIATAALARHDVKSVQEAVKWADALIAELEGSDVADVAERMVDR